MVVHAIDHFHRESEFAHFCAVVTDILPLLGADAMGLSQAIKIIYRQWKHRNEAENRNKTAYPMILHHNPMNPETSAALLVSGWLAVAGHAKKGPLYGNLRPGGHGIRVADHTRPGTGDEAGADIWFDVDGNRVNFTARQVADLMNKMINRVIILDGGKTPRLMLVTVHGLCRVTGPGWCARGGDGNSVVQCELAGRWKAGSGEMHKYWNRGASMKAEYLLKEQEDPIHAYKPWPAQGQTFQETLDSTGGEGEQDADNHLSQQRTKRRKLMVLKSAQSAAN